MSDGARVPTFVIAAVVTIVTTAVIAGATAIVDTREDVARVQERTDKVEEDTAHLRSMPVAIGRMETKIDTLTEEVGKLRGSRK